MSTETLDRLKLLFIALYRDNANERSNAAGLFYKFLVDNAIHPTQIDLLVGVDLIERNREVIRCLEAEIQRLSAENQQLRQRASHPDLTGWLAVRDWIIATWGEPPDWRRRLAKLAQVPLPVIDQWKAGTAQVPDNLLDVLRQSAEPAKPKAKRTKRPNVRQKSILQGLAELQEATIRRWSFHLYGEPDSNENLADAVSTMLDNKWLQRKARKADRDDKSIWTYRLSQEGAQWLNDNTPDIPSD